MNTPQFSGLPAQAYPLGDQQKKLSGLNQNLSDHSAFSANDNSFVAVIDRLADWVYFQNELEFE